jgi:hypothetical protein
MQVCRKTLFVEEFDCKCAEDAFAKAYESWVCRAHARRSSPQKVLSRIYYDK